MSFLGKFFNRKPLEGLLEINESVLAFDYCFNTDVMEDDEFKVYIEGIVEQLHDDFPEASFMVFNFRGGKSHTLIDDILSNYDMTVVDYPRQYQDCPLLALETIYHFLKSSESWLSVGEHNMLLMNCERGGWPILAFVLSALVLYMKQYNGERKTLDMIYKLGPSELLPLMSPLNPIPSQVRYLQYVSRRNVGTQWPPLDRQLLLDCVILRVIPQFDGAGGCRPIFKVYGQDPFVATNRTPKVLFSTPKKGKPVRHYKQEDCPLVKIDIRCHVQGDVVVECINLDDDMEHEEMIFRAMFNTAFLRSNILMLNRNDIDMFWHCQDRFAKEFRAEILFSEMDAATTPVSNEVRGFEEKGLPMEAFAKVQEIFSNVDLLDTKTEIALDVLQQIDQSTVLQEKLETGSSISVEAGNLLLKIVPENFQENQASPAESRTPEKLFEWKQSTYALKLSIDVKDSEPQEQVSLSQSKIISQRMPQTAVPPDSNSYQSEPSSLGITTAEMGIGSLLPPILISPSSTKGFGQSKQSFALKIKHSKGFRVEARSSSFSPDSRSIRIPHQWYNLIADLPIKPPPPLHPKTFQPVKPDDLSPLFPDELIKQEASTDRFIDIPDEVHDVYRLWRPTPLIRAKRLEKLLGTPARIYYKYEGGSPAGSHKPNTAVPQVWYNAQEGVKNVVTETGAGQWGSSLAFACSLFDLNCEVWQVRASYDQKPYRRLMMQTWGAKVHPSPSDITEIGRNILKTDTSSPGSLGIAISEAVEVAAMNRDTKYCLGSVLNHVLLHQTVIGEECIDQMEAYGETPDVIIGCTGGGSNFAGLSFPFIREKMKGRMNPVIRAVEPTACPSLTKGVYAYDFGDTAGLTPLMKMHTLGHDFIPDPIHAGGLRYHGMAPLISHVYELGYMEAISIPQTECFRGAIQFARTEGIIPAPEPTHAIAATIREALHCKETGQAKVILMAMCGHGHFDLPAYEKYLQGKMVDLEFAEERVRDSLAKVPKF